MGTKVLQQHVSDVLTAQMVIPGFATNFEYVALDLDSGHVIGAATHIDHQHIVLFSVVEAQLVSHQASKVSTWIVYTRFSIATLINSPS